MKEKKIWGDLVETADGSMTLRHPEKQEEYHSTQGARFEAEELYIMASGFHLAMQDGKEELAVLDVGLGLAYNALSTIQHWWHGAGQRDVSLHSLEVNGDLVQALADGTAPWMQGWSPEWLQWAQSLRQVSDQLWQANLQHPSKKTLTWTVRISDAASDPDWNQRGLRFDYVWQDPFSPQKNPEMWTAEWFARLAATVKPDATLVTYSVARSVRDALTAAGWSWQKLQASGKKRNWLRASLAAIELA
ncbi:MAG: tRNA (5-methylaminomethyl-2-thiouridine)(34)-methyltransferase MnmD [Oligoflexus sp.]